MGLDIKGKKTEHHIRSAYSRLHHTARFLSYICCGGPLIIGKDPFYSSNEEMHNVYGFNFYMHPYIGTKKIDQEKLLELIGASQLMGRFFPNLNMHSDAEGNYTKNGPKAPSKCWQKGNSIQLLEELETLCNDNDLIMHESERVRSALDYTTKFRDLVKDEIENGCGTIIFY